MSKAAKLLDRAGRSKPMLYGIAALLSAGFGVFVILTAEKVNVYYPIPTAVIFGGLFFLAQALLIAQDRFDALSRRALRASCFQEWRFYTLNPTTTRRF